MALNKALLKAEMKELIFAIYGGGEVASTSDVWVYGEQDLSEYTSVANASYPDKANEVNIDYPIKGRLQCYFDSVIADGRKEFLMQYVWTWRVTYDAQGDPTVSKLGGTYEWDPSHKQTKDIIEQAKITGWTRS